MMTVHEYDELIKDMQRACKKVTKPETKRRMQNAIRRARHQRAQRTRIEAGLERANSLALRKVVHSAILNSQAEVKKLDALGNPYTIVPKMTRRSSFLYKVSYYCPHWIYRIVLALHDRLGPDPERIR